MSMAVKEAVLPRPAVLPQSQGLLSRQRPAQVSAAPRELSMVSAAALHSSLPLLQSEKAEHGQSSSSILRGFV